MSGLKTRYLGTVDYQEAFTRQKTFVSQRDAATVDEIWYLEHPPVYTLGLAGRPEHILNRGGVPLCQSDRGGQVTYHGPGQLVVYLLLDLKRKGISVKQYVYTLEEAVLRVLEGMGIQGHRKNGAPGIYVDDRKLAALGIRIRRGYCYHGIAVNVDMDLSPFAGIDPCGYPGLEVTQMADLGLKLDTDTMASLLIPCLVDALDYDASPAQASTAKTCMT